MRKFLSTLLLCSMVLLSGCEQNISANPSIAENVESTPEADTEQSTQFERLFQNHPVPVQDPNGLWGFIDIAGEYVISPAYQDACQFNTDGIAAVQDVDTQQWGYINVAGEYTISPKFLTVNAFRKKMATVQDAESGLWGVINTSGEYIVPPEYIAMGDEFREGFLPVTKSNVFWGYIDSSGAYLVNEDYYYACDFSEGLALVNEGGLMGYIDTTGQYAIEPKEYANATSFSNGVAFVAEWVGDRECYKMIDREGNALTEPIFSNLGAKGRLGSRKRPDDFGTYIWFSNDLHAISIVNQPGEVFINNKGEIVLPKSGKPYTEALDFNNGYARVIDAETGMVGYIDTEGKWVVPPEYKPSDMPLLQYFDGEILTLYPDVNTWQMFDAAGDMIGEFHGDGNLSVDMMRPERIRVVVEYGNQPNQKKATFLNAKGEQITDYFEDANRFSADYSYAKMKEGGLWGIIDSDGNWLISPQFLDIRA